MRNPSPSRKRSNCYAGYTSHYLNTLNTLTIKLENKILILRSFLFEISQLLVIEKKLRSNWVSNIA